MPIRERIAMAGRIARRDQWRRRDMVSLFSEPYSLWRDLSSPEQKFSSNPLWAYGCGLVSTARVAHRGPLKQPTDMVSSSHFFFLPSPT